MPPADGPPAPRYAFGDSDAAAVRLEVLAVTFGAASRSLVSSLRCSPLVVLDLGCGPGHTTAMLADAWPSARVVGVDTSHAFAVRAAAGAAPRCSFVVGDVTRPPLPCAPADAVYGRFLLVHLADPLVAAARWVGELAPGGVLVLEEPEAIDTADADFVRYLELASRVVAARGGDLYAGRQLAGWAAPPGAEVVVANRAAVTVAAGAAARIFSLNIGTWGSDAALAGAADAGEVAALRARLARRTGDPSTGVIGWHMRQLALRRT